MAILRAIREAPALEHIRVIVVSSQAGPIQIAEIADLGALYRSKPSELSKVEFAAEIIAICKSPVPATSL